MDVLQMDPGSSPGLAPGWPGCRCQRAWKGKSRCWRIPTMHFYQYWKKIWTAESWNWKTISRDCLESYLSIRRLNAINYPHPIGIPRAKPGEGVKPMHSYENFRYVCTDERCSSMKYISKILSFIFVSTYRMHWITMNFCQLFAFVSIFSWTYSINLIFVI